MNNAWRNLLIIGILMLITTIGWEIYQSTDGGRSEFNPVINRLDRNLLFTPTLEQHIRNGEANLIRDRDEESELTIQENIIDDSF